MKPIEIKEKLLLSLFPYVLNEPIDFHERLAVTIKEDPEFVAALAHLYHDVFSDEQQSIELALSLFLSEESKVKGKALLFAFMKQPEDVLSVLYIYLTTKGKPLANSMKKLLEEKFQLFQPHEFYQAKTKVGTVDFRDFLQLVHPKPLNKEQEHCWGSLLKNEEKRTLSVYQEPHQLMRTYEKEAMCTMIQRDKAPLFQVFETLLFLQKRTVKMDPSITDALEEQLKKQTKLLPKWKGKTFIASDVSASMRTPLSPTNLNTYADLAHFFMLIAPWQCEKSILGFYANQFERFHDVYQETITEKWHRMQRVQLGYENHAKEAITYLLEHALSVERILLFSDKPSIHEELQALLETYQENVNPNVHIHLFYLAGERGKIYKQNNLHCYSGWNPSFAQLLFYIEQTPTEAVRTIEQRKNTTSS